MKPFCFAASLVVLATGCASTGAPADNPSAQQVPAGTEAYILHGPEAVTPGYATSKPPRLSVGVSYPDTQLILPWFLNDIINFINYR